MMNNVLTSTFSDLVLGIDHVALAVEDIDASIDWYTSTLGFSLAERKAVSGERHDVPLSEANIRGLFRSVEEKNLY